MEFDKSKVYTAVNADELKQGDKVIVANTISKLRERVEQFEENDIVEIGYIAPDTEARRFNEDYILAYLVERKENCTNCGCRDRYSICKYEKPNPPEMTKCDNWQPKTTEKHYRPFKNIDELLKVWGKKIKFYCDEIPSIVMPLVWVKYKYDKSTKGSLITNFSNDHVCLNEKDEDYMTMYDLFINFTFLDGSPCGVEE